ncbi:MAG: glycosyltransferase family 4 protein [Vicinamibacterales bacterium]
MTPPSLDPSSRRPSRVAWFTPMPPSSSGIAAYSAEILPALRARGLQLDVYVDPEQGADPTEGQAGAQDFVWRHRRRPYDLVIYQMGNAACHGYMWGYLFRYPGLVVLHDAQVHQARAQALLGRWEPRRDDYLAEFAANHPAAPPDAARLVAEGLGGRLFGLWPHVRLLLQAARLCAVHSAALAASLEDAHGVPVRAVPMGVRDPRLDAGPLTAAAVRARHGLGPEHLVIGAVGGLTPEKRLPELLAAVAALAPHHPELHVLLVGTPALHYDVAADAATRGLADRVHFTGFVPDADLPAHLDAVDLCACLRWPTNRETSASWLRAVAAGRPTIVTDLAHQPELPVVDPRDWQSPSPRPIAVAVPILEEGTGLLAAIAGLARSPARRARIGAAARDYWRAHHTIDHMADAYVELIAEAATRPIPQPALPAHLADSGEAQLGALLAPFGLAVPGAVAG